MGRHQDLPKQSQVFLKGYGNTDTVFVSKRGFFFFYFKNREAVRILLHQKVFEIGYCGKGEKMQGVNSLYESRERLML